MGSQTNGIGSADISESMCSNVRTIPALLPCACQHQRFVRRPDLLENQSGPARFFHADGGGADTVEDGETLAVEAA